MVSIDINFITQGLTAKELMDFLVTMDDKTYKEWYPGTHLKCIRKKHRFYKDEPFLGDIYYTAEKVGGLRMPLNGIVTSYTPGKQITWQGYYLGIALPGAVRVDLADIDGGLKVQGSLLVGFEGIGKIFDPIIRLFIPKKLMRLMEEHAKEELPMLGEMLHTVSRS